MAGRNPSTLTLKPPSTKLVAGVKPVASSRAFGLSVASGTVELGLSVKITLSSSNSILAISSISVDSPSATVYRPRIMSVLDGLEFPSSSSSVVNVPTVGLVLKVTITLPSNLITSSKTRSISI